MCVGQFGIQFGKLHRRHKIGQHSDGCPWMFLHFRVRNNLSYVWFVEVPENLSGTYFGVIYLSFSVSLHTSPKSHLKFAFIYWEGDNSKSTQFQSICICKSTQLQNIRKVYVFKNIIRIQRPVSPFLCPNILYLCPGLPKPFSSRECGVEAYS